MSGGWEGFAGFIGGADAETVAVLNKTTDEEGFVSGLIGSGQVDDSQAR